MTEDKDIEIPAGRGARRQARRLARANAGVFVCVVSRRGWGLYQAVWTRHGFLTYVFDRSAGIGKPSRCLMVPDQFDRAQRPVRLPTWKQRRQ